MVSLPSEVTTYLATRKMNCLLSCMLIVLAISGYIWITTEFVHAGDLEKFAAKQEIRALQKEKRSYERDKLRLTVKKQALPTQYTPVDDAILKDAEVQIKYIDDQIRAIQRGEVQHF